MNDRTENIKLLGATYEAMGQTTTPAALTLIADDLEPYGIKAVATALNKCRRELTGRLTPAAIIERIQSADGRPQPNEAWAIALQSADERDTVVWNNEIAAGMAAARDILDAGDEVGARMAFIEAYKREVQEARDKCISVSWWPSLGYDSSRHAGPIERAIEQGKLTREYAINALPHIFDRDPEASFDRLLSGPAAKANPEKSRAIIDQLKTLFSETKH
jgi:hypothetical protein